MKTQSCYTKIESRIKDELVRLGEGFDPIQQPAWYFVTNFEDIRDGVPYGRLMRYEKDDLPFAPSLQVDLPGRVVGEVEFRDGRAYFRGRGYVEFEVLSHDANAIDPEIEVRLADPKPLLMIGHGQIARPLPKSQLGNPVIYYKSDKAEFGLFAPNGRPVSKVNHEVFGQQTDPDSSILPESNSTIWFAYVAESLPSATEGQRHRWVHEVVDFNDILGCQIRHEYQLNQAFDATLRHGSTIIVGGVPDGVANIAPFEGFIEEAIVDPTRGQGQGGSGGNRIGSGGKRK